MDINQAIKYFGSGNKLAKALDITRQNITIWKQRGIPLLHQYRLEELTGGKLKRTMGGK